MSTLTSIGSFIKRLRYGARIDPVRDWLVLLTLSTIVLAALLAWNVWAFDTVAKGGTIGAPQAVVAPVFSRSSLDVIHTIFADRATEETKYRTGAYTFTDPSQ